MGFWSDIYGGLDRTVGGALPGGVGYSDSYLGMATGGVTAATVGTVGYLGTFIPGGAPAGDTSVFRNAYRLGSGQPKLYNDGRTQSWTDAAADAGAATAEWAAAAPANVLEAVGSPLLKSPVVLAAGVAALAILGGKR